MNANMEERKKAAAQVREAFPALERRTSRHDPPIGLERFARRARALYLKEEAVLFHQQHVQTRMNAEDLRLIRNTNKCDLIGMNASVSGKRCHRSRSGAVS